MQVTCPICHLNGVYDADPGVTESRVICARCSSEYDVVLVDGQFVTALQAAEPVAAEVAPQFARPQAVPAAAPADEPVLDDVFAVMPDEESDFFDANSPILEDVFAPSIVAAKPEAERAAARVETTFAEESGVAATDAATADAQETQAEPAPKIAQAARFDGYSAGTRVMQASPVWLLVCGLAFVGCIVLFNRITSEAGGEVAASAQSVVRNDATNQAAASSFMPDVEIKSEPAAAPARAEAANETAQTVVIPAAEQVSPQAAKEAAAPVESEAPAVAQEARAEVATPAPAQSSGGRFTVQVGAHNARDKAEAQAERMKSAGVEARVVAAEVPNRGTWYRVQAGRFESREEATRRGAEMRARGVAQTVVVAEIQ